MPYSMNFGHNKIEDQQPDVDKYMVSPNQNMIDESFENNVLKKSTTIDGTYKGISSKIINNHGISGNAHRSGSQYGVTDENECVTSSGTWDQRNSSSYISKGYVKNPKQASYTKKQMGYHK